MLQLFALTLLSFSLIQGNEAFTLKEVEAEVSKFSSLLLNPVEESSKVLEEKAKRMTEQMEEDKRAKLELLAKLPEECYQPGLVHEVFGGSGETCANLSTTMNLVKSYGERGLNLSTSIGTWLKQAVEKAATCKSQGFLKGASCVFRVISSFHGKFSEFEPKVVKYGKDGIKIFWKLEAEFKACFNFKNEHVAKAVKCANKHG